MGKYDDQSSTFGGSKSPISLAIHFFTKHLNKNNRSQHHHIKTSQNILEATSNPIKNKESASKHSKNIQKTSKKQPKSPQPDSQAPQAPQGPQALPSSRRHGYAPASRDAAAVAAAVAGLAGRGGGGVFTAGRA